MWFSEVYISLPRSEKNINWILHKMEWCLHRQVAKHKDIKKKRSNTRTTPARPLAARGNAATISSGISNRSLMNFGIFMQCVLLQDLKLSSY